MIFSEASQEGKKQTNQPKHESIINNRYNKHIELINY